MRPERHIPNSVETLSRDLEAAARTLGLQLDVLHGSTERDIDDAFATLVQRRAGALVIVADAFFNSQSERGGDVRGYLDTHRGHPTEGKLTTLYQ